MTAPNFVVALCELARPLEEEEEALASILGVTPYDARIRAGGVLPKITQQVETRDEALALTDALRRRGHGVVAFDVADVVSTGAMVPMRRFGLEGGVLYANDRKPPSRPVGELAALARVVVQAHVQRKTREVAYTFTTRGSIRKELEKTSGEQHAEDALVLFFDEGVPWILRPSDARYLALGAEIRPTVRENFLYTVDWLRFRAGSAVYDDRFARAPLVSRRPLGVRGNNAPSFQGDRTVDVQLHALGLWLRRGRGGPYR